MSGTLGPWFLANKPTVALQDPNASLATLAGAAGQNLSNQTAQQNLDDRSSLRDLAGGLAGGDLGAAAQASVLGPVGTGAVTAVDAARTSQRTNLAGYASMAANLAGSVAALPADQQAAAYQVGRQQLSAIGMPDTLLPAQHPGTAALLALRNAQLPAATQVELNANYPNFTGSSNGPMGAPIGGGNVPAGGRPTGSPPSSAIPNVTPDAAFSSIVDPQARDLASKAAAAVGMAPEAIPFWIAGLHNESGGSPNLHVHDGASGEIGPGQIMPATGQGMGYSPAQLRDPATNLQASAQYFAQQWKASNGDPAGALRGYNGGNPGNMRAQGYATQALGRMNAWGQPSAPGAAPGAPVRVASINGTAGMPQTATDAPSGILPQPTAAPSGLASIAAPPATASASQSPNGLLAASAAAPATPPDVLTALGLPLDLPAAAPAATTSSLAPAPPSPALPQLTAVPGIRLGNGQPAPAGTIIGSQKGLPIPGKTPGMVMARFPDGTMGEVMAPGTANTGRLTAVPTPDGGKQLVAPSGEVVTSAGPDLAARQNEAYKADIPRQQELIGSLQANQAQQLRQNEIAQVAAGLATGPTAELRAKGAQYLEAMGVAPDVIQRWTGMSSGSQAQELVKLGITAAGGAAKDTAGANTGIGSISLYQSANPGLMLLPDANKRVTNMMRVGTQASIDYAQGALAHFDQNSTGFNQQGKSYTPLSSYDAGWAKQANPQVYAGAMGILNGDAPEKWGARLTPDQKQAAMDVAKRVDPTTGQAPATQAAPPRVGSAADYQAVPSGGLYIHPDGSTRRKP